jgi:hypothetical protein
METSLGRIETTEAEIALKSADRIRVAHYRRQMDSMESVLGCSRKSTPQRVADAIVEAGLKRRYVATLDARAALLLARLRIAVGDRALIRMLGRGSPRTDRVGSDRFTAEAK